VKEINKKTQLDYIHTILKRACSGLDRYPLYLVVDRARIHNIAHILKEFHAVGCEEMHEIILLSRQSAQRMSANEWNRIQKRATAAFYKHCKISGRAEPMLIALRRMSLNTTTHNRVTLFLLQNGFNQLAELARRLREESFNTGRLRRPHHARGEGKRLVRGQESAWLAVRLFSHSDPLALPSFVEGDEVRAR